MDEVKLKRSRFEVMMFLTSYGLLVPVAISLSEAHIGWGTSVTACVYHYHFKLEITHSRSILS
jgi:hypothetical protein